VPIFWLSLLYIHGFTLPCIYRGVHWGILGSQFFGASLDRLGTFIIGSALLVIQTHLGKKGELTMERAFEKHE
jgi:hypothetical protein